MTLPSERHGSSGADSFRSDDTVRADWNERRNSPFKAPSGENQRLHDDSEISPRSRAPYTASSSRSMVTPWEEEPSYGRADNRSPHLRAPSGTEAFPNLSPETLASTPWSSGGSPAISPSGAPSQYGKSLDKGSPSYPATPTIGRTESWGGSPFGDERRPSIASATTVSSSGSNHSKTMHKNLTGFFGEDPEIEWQGNNGTPTGKSDSLKPPFSTQSSLSKLGSRQTSPDGGRAHTPQPSSEVTPWMYQDPEDINTYGDAPVREDRTDRGSNTNMNAPVKPTNHSHSHKLPFHLHRHQKSKDSKDETKSPDQETRDSPRHTPSKHGSVTPLRSESTVDVAEDLSSQPGDSPSNGSKGDHHAKSSKDGGSGKRSLFDKLRNRNKNDRAAPDTLKGPGSQTSLQHSQTLPVQPPLSTAEPSKSSQKGGLLSRSSTHTEDASQSSQKKEHHSRIPFKGKRGTGSEAPTTKDPNMVRPDAVAHESVWKLDTDLSHMEGIVGNNQPLTTPPSGGNRTGWLGDDLAKDPSNVDASAGSWDAPDSWAVKRDMNMDQMRDMGEDAIPEEGDPGPDHSIRIFRSDGSFLTLSLPLNTSTAEVMHQMGKKTSLQEDLANYHIIVRKHTTSRQLEPNERPLLIQKRMLEQAGYRDADNIDQLGLEDHSYLCRFTFLPAKMSGYSSLEKDPSFKTQKLSNVDLSGRNLVTIPIALYKKASEIVFLNLSRNLSLDVPKDFVQGCTSLREIRYTGNEAVRLPPSFSLASKLTVLDISNNKLEQLEHAELYKLENLASLKLANNKLTALPDYFAQFSGLRSLNLSSNSLTELPKCVCDIKTLVDLDISFNSISGLPHIGNLENLERLWATNNKLSGRTEDTVANCHNLREVDIRFNEASNIDVFSELPQLEQLMAGHNLITAFEGTFAKIRILYLDHNPVTRFGLGDSVPTLSTLSLASAKLAQFPDELFQRLSGLTKLILDKNHFVSLPPSFGKLQKLESLSIAKNSLSTLPPEIGRLGELRYLDARENNINQLPPELWLCRKLETLNLSSNVLGSFPKPPTQYPSNGADQQGQNGAPAPSFVPSTPTIEETNKLAEFGHRRQSQASGQTSTATSPGSASYRKGSIASMYASSRKPSLLSRTSTDGSMSPISRKDSILMTRINSTFAGSLRNILLADNRLSDEVFDQLAMLQELKVLNTSYNELYEIPSRTLRKWQYLSELYLSGNDLTSLPSEDLEIVSALRVLHINGNKFQVLPAELGKVPGLAILDVASNSLKYNVSNWPYDWNWNCNPDLKYLNLSGNKRLEIRPSSTNSGRGNQNLTDFNALSKLRVLGLMDVTLMISSVPDTTEDRRVRTSGSAIGTMPYGIADSLGRNEHLSTLDLVDPRIDGHDDEALIALFDGISTSGSGSKIVMFLNQNFLKQFKEELRKSKQNGENAGEALRRAYLALNKQLATVATQPNDMKRKNALSPDDLNSGSVATVLYIHGQTLHVSNVGDAEAVLIQSGGSHKVITRKHDPASMDERQRIREAGGYVSKQGKLNDVLDVSRAFGFTQLMPSVIAAPHIMEIALTESDEIILLASSELWDYLTPDFAVDLARSEREDLMRAAQKLRDLAIAFGATDKITVMMIGVHNLCRKEKPRYRTHSMSMGPSGNMPDEYNSMSRRGKRLRDTTLDSKLARLDQEVEAPVGEVSLAFTDIKNSTLLWETYPIAMRSAIKMHNEVMRRHLRLIGGYEVKTEGDAFMVAFPTVTSALLWCFTIQSQLLEVQWPQEILNSVNGQEVMDADGVVLFKGLSVRMGIHFGTPVCETDPVTRRMDYFGPMVNRAARISAVADGGQITVSSDFIAEVQRLLETYIETDRSNSQGSEDSMNDDAMSVMIRRELNALSSHGFEVKDLGEKRLKGLENPEFLYLMYPSSLKGRLLIQQQRAEAVDKAGADGHGAKVQEHQLVVDLENLWSLWKISLRLEMLCSALECPDTSRLKPPETALLERTRERGGEVTDRFLINFVEHQISRIETCITSLALRNMIRPFRDGMLQQACPMADVMKELSSQLEELRYWKEQNDIDMAPS